MCFTILAFIIISNKNIYIVKITVVKYIHVNSVLSKCIQVKSHYPEPANNFPRVTNCGRAIAQAVSRRLPTAAPDRGAPGSSPGQLMWDLWWKKWHWGRFSPSTLFSPANSHSSDCSTFIIIYYSALVQ
jgi:hypothetical protein